MKKSIILILIISISLFAENINIRANETIIVNLEHGSKIYIYSVCLNNNLFYIRDKVLTQAFIEHNGQSIPQACKSSK